MLKYLYLSHHGYEGKLFGGRFGGKWAIRP